MFDIYACDATSCLTDLYIGQQFSDFSSYFAQVQAGTIIGVPSQSSYNNENYTDYIFSPVTNPNNCSIIFNMHPEFVKICQQVGSQTCCIITDIIINNSTIINNITNNIISKNIVQNTYKLLNVLIIFLSAIGVFVVLNLILHLAVLCNSVYRDTFKKASEGQKIFFFIYCCIEWMPILDKYMILKHYSKPNTTLKIERSSIISNIIFISIMVSVITNLMIHANNFYSIISILLPTLLPLCIYIFVIII